ncbi:glycosyltransferase [Microbacterium sp. 179-I 3D2 NHS]|uniref:glycosyltransferase n=1 Tax=Microbacterium sp. 179-I 3D2 NHS TaxID=3235178 RepID=UPI0039A19859
MRLFVSVGTDHHPFGRLIGWVDRWAQEHPDVDLVVQHGSSPASTVGVNHHMMTGDELTAHYGAADIVVSQVGPGTIADANAAGVRPIVVPRDPALGEVVDDHQSAFGDFMAARERCIVVRDEKDLRRTLDRTLADPGSVHFDAEAGAASASTAVAELAQRIVAAPRRRVSLRALRAMARRTPDDEGAAGANEGTTT